MRVLLPLVFLFAIAAPAAAQISPPSSTSGAAPSAELLCPDNAPNGLQKDWKKAIWRVPLHIALSLPFTAASIVVPPAGKAYVRWRIRAEKQDAARGLDTCMKATIDLYGQTALPRAILKMYGVSFQ